MNSEDDAIEEMSSQIVDSVLAEATDKSDEIEDEFIKSLINSQQRQKTPSPPPPTSNMEKTEELVAIIETDPIGLSSDLEPENVEEVQPAKEPAAVEQSEQKNEPGIV